MICGKTVLFKEINIYALMQKLSGFQYHFELMFLQESSIFPQEIDISGLILR